MRKRLGIMMLAAALLLVGVGCGSGEEVPTETLTPPPVEENTTTPSAPEETEEVYSGPYNPLTGEPMVLPQEDVCHYKGATRDGLKGVAVLRRASEAIQAARQFITREGVALTDSVEDGQLVEMYAAYLVRKRATTEPMPRMLRWALNNRLFSQKAGGGNAS